VPVWVVSSGCKTGEREDHDFMLMVMVTPVRVFLIQLLDCDVNRAVLHAPRRNFAVKPRSPSLMEPTTAWVLSVQSGEASS
jgi:hypothetical protein